MRKLSLVIICLFMNFSLGFVANAAETTNTSLKSANISINPLGLLIGSLGMDLDFGVADSITVGPTFGYFSLTATSGTSTATASFISIGASAKFFLGHNRFTDGWFVSPNLGYSIASVSGTSTLLTTAQSTSSLGIGANVGYWWFYNSGFNIGLAGGASYSFSGRFAPALLFNIGFAF